MTTATLNPKTQEKPIWTIPATARHTAALATLDALSRELAEEALTVNLEYVNNEMFKKSNAEVELFDEGMEIAD